MRRVFGFALCAGLAGVLAVVYTLLHLDWGTDPAPPAAAQPAAVLDVPEDADRGAPVKTPDGVNVEGRARDAGESGARGR